MKKEIPIFNADVGHEFDSKSVELKKKNSIFTVSYLFFYFLELYLLIYLSKIMKQCG